MMILKKQYIAYQAIVLNEIVRILRIWSQSLLPPAITMALYFIIFGALIGSQLHSIEGFSYVQYIAPGLIMMPIITASYVNTLRSFYMAKFHRNIEEVLVSPMPNYIILLGYVSGSVIRASFIGGIVTIVALFFTHVQMHHLFFAILIVFLASILFALIGFTNAIFAKSFDDISFVPNFILTPLTYLGGVFYSIKLLPTVWRHVSLFNPVVYIINVFRYGFLGISDVNIAIALGVILLFIVVFFMIDLYLLRRGVGVRE